MGTARSADVVENDLHNEDCNGILDVCEYGCNVDVLASVREMRIGCWQNAAIIVVN